MLEFLYYAVAVIFVLIYGVAYLNAEYFVETADPVKNPNLSKMTADEFRGICVQSMFCSVVWPVLLFVLFVKSSIRKVKAK